MSGGGYCSEAFAFLATLRFLNITAIAKHHGDTPNPQFLHNLSQQDRELLHQPSRKAYMNPTTGKPKFIVAVCHSEPGAWSTPTPRYTSTNPCPPPHADYAIGRTMFETDRLPDGWAGRISFLEEVWVPTKFSKGIFVAGGVKRVVVVGEPVDTDFFRPMFTRPDPSTPSAPVEVGTSKEAAISTLRSIFSPLTHHLLPAVLQDTVMFLFVGKWEQRKGIEILLRAYATEFKASEDNVLLVILTSSYHSSDDFDQLVKQALGELSPSPPYIILPPIPQVHLPILFSLPHTVLAVPSHGEGWGRPHVEAMSCGMPIIATNWSGPTEYLDNTTGYPIPIEGLIDTPNWPGHRWSNPSQSALSDIMRHVYTQESSNLSEGSIVHLPYRSESLASMGNRARACMVGRYSVQRMSAVVGRELQRVLRVMQERAKEEDL